MADNSCVLWCGKSLAATYVRLVTDKLTKHKTVNTSKSSSVQEKFLLAFEICLFQFFFFLSYFIHI